jgi:predicted fused transcriptional regulator/phosphomethylpyrimidine kinase
MKYSNITEARRLAPKLPAIYMICPADGSNIAYIGATSNLYRRMVEHGYQIKSRPAKQKGLSEMLLKFGMENCVVNVLFLDEDKSLSKEDISYKEAAHMQQLKDAGYIVVSTHGRLNTGNSNNFYGHTHSAKVKAKASRKVIYETGAVGIEFDCVNKAAIACNRSAAWVIKQCQKGLTNGIGWSYSTDVIKPVDFSQIDTEENVKAA